MSAIHAHVSRHSSDCDGTYTSGWTMTMTAEEVVESQQDVNDFSDIHFTERVVCEVVNAYSLIGTGDLRVTRFSDGDVRLSWSEATEEGFVNVEATICRDECPDSQPWQRDHAAEAAGY